MFSSFSRLTDKTAKVFDTYVENLKDKVYRFAKKILNDHDDAQDVMQDVFERLWKMRKELNKFNSVDAFTIRMTKNLCLDRIKHKKVKYTKLKLIREQTDIMKTDDYSKTETSEIIKMLIERLPEKQKMIMHLRDIEGLEFREIAEIMEMELNAVRMNVSRARKTVKEQLIKIMNYGLQRSYKISR